MAENNYNMLSTAPYKGTRDFYPEEMKIRTWFFNKMREIVELHCYEEYDGPVLEHFEIYAAKSGEEIAKEQTYNFVDKGERRIAIRPEMTPTVARMVAGKLGQISFPLRWYSIPNLLRYENPQRGRLREHWQLNVDLFGDQDIKADLEIINVVVDLMKGFKADKSMFKVKINNRRFLNEILVTVLKADEEKVRKVSKALDRRAKITKEQYFEWLEELGVSKETAEVIDSLYALSVDQIIEKLKLQSKGAEEIKELFSLLRESKLDEYCEFDLSVVRGFDYYTGTVFEVFDTSPKNKRSLFGGGRYDNLVGLFKANANVSGIGFGFGDVTLQDFLETHNLIPDLNSDNNKVLVTTFGDVNYNEYVKIANQLRADNLSCCIFFDNQKKLKSQLSFAEKNRFNYVIICGAEELENNIVTVKDMRQSKEYKFNRNEYTNKIKELFN